MMLERDMTIRKTSAKTCIVCVSIALLLGDVRIVDSLPFGSSPQVILLVVSIFLPSIAVLKDHYRLYMASVVVCSVKMLVGLVSWPLDVSIVPVSLLAVTIVLSFFLAVEDVALRVSAEIIDECSRLRGGGFRVIELRILWFSYALLSVS